LTLASISLLAYMLGDILHEAAGHGGACLLVGAQPVALSSVYFECSVGNRLVTAGGTLMNLIAAVVFFALGRFIGREYPRWKYFFWISMTVNLYTGTGYFLFSGIGGIGDWADFIRGLGPQWLWRIGLTIFGAATYGLAAIISLRELRPFLGNEKEQRYQRAVRLSAIPYFAGGILMCIAGALNPKGAILILISAAASTFGGTSGLLWAPSWLRSPALIPYGPPAEALPIRRNWPLVAMASILAIVFIVVLGPSIRFAQK
jgi:hypothetical protein